MKFLFGRKKKTVRKETETPSLTDKDFVGVPERFQAIYHDVKIYTMTSPERIFSLCEAVEYLCRSGIDGDMVECGVWKGGSMMAVAYTLLDRRAENRQLWLYDTFDGMSEPSDLDVDYCGQRADELMRLEEPTEEASVWCRAEQQIVQDNLVATKYPEENLNFVAGDVGRTLTNPDNLPEKIALLRLDTDWYESTKIELELLFPRLVPGGVIIVDDYGHWQGCRAAVDEYFCNNGINILLNRIDYTGRIGVKPQIVGVEEVADVS